MTYAEFLEGKTHSAGGSGFEPTFLPDELFGFQRSLTTWACLQGRGAMFADCGLGKTPMELTWAENVARHTGKPVLLLTPLAVSAQTIREAEKFGIECSRSQDGTVKGRIVVTNYERLEHFHPDDFAGVVLDESSILKSFDGSRKAQITEFLKKVEYRLLATATAAPNDYIELGTSSEALGQLGFMDMLNRFFKNDQNNSGLRATYGEAPKWRFKGHAEIPFWRWVASWARACRKPSDLGFDDGAFILPPLKETYHMVDALTPPPGLLFNVPAVDLDSQREEKKRTIEERCERMAALVNDTGQPFFIGCQLDAEADLLERLIPDAVQVSGKQSNQVKEDRLLAFQDGQSRGLVIKDRMGAWGLNFQHCAHVGLFPTHSYESYYQFVRRCWRFGQKRPVTVDIVLTEGEQRVMDNLKRKGAAASVMFSHLVREMALGMALEHRTTFEQTEEVPSWL